MSQRVKLKVRAQQPVRFPGLCVNCAKPSEAWMGLRRRVGRVTRQIDVPLCGDCRDQLRRLSGEEERLHKLGNLFAALLFLLTLVVTLLIIPTGLPLTLRLLLSMSSALFLAESVLIISRRVSRRSALPDKQAIVESATINDFSWRATVFEFENETFAESFKALNEAALMEI